MPTYNRAEMLLRAVESVLRQTRNCDELIIVDDGSTDGTEQIVRAIGDPTVRYIRQQNRGVSAARNTGLQVAQSEIVTFLDSDDEVDTLWLETYASLFENRRVGLAFVGARYISQRDTGRSEVLRVPRQMGSMFHGTVGLLAPAGVYAARRRLLLEVGGYADGLVFGENTELLIRLTELVSKEGWDTSSSSQPLVNYFRRDTESGKLHQKPRERLAAVEYILTRHDRALRRNSRVHGNYHAIAGVCAAKCGEYAVARHHFAAAIRAHPITWRHYIRLFLALAPMTGRLYWNRSGS